MLISECRIVKYKLKFLVLSLVIVGCSPVKEIGRGHYSTSGFSQYSAQGAKNIAYSNAKKTCATKGGGVVLENESSDVHRNLIKGYSHDIAFRCYDVAEEKRQEELKKEEEANKQRQIAAEKAAKDEAERKEREAEWERTRPQREEEARRQQAALNEKLNIICPRYYIARQLCATASLYQNCMMIRMGNKYSSFEDSLCFNR